MLRENKRNITNASEVAEIFNVFYSSISNYPVNLYDCLDYVNMSDAVAKHCVHESIVNIKSHMGEPACQFEFCKLLELEVSNKIRSLKCSKLAGHDGIQYKFLKMGGEKSLCLLFNNAYRLFYISYDYVNGRNFSSV